jgi:hypothetical protein
MNRIIIFSTIVLMGFFICSCNKKGDNPISNVASTLISNSNSFLYDEYGLDFSSKSSIHLNGQVEWHNYTIVSQVDLGLSDGIFIASPNVVSSDSLRPGSIKDLGIIDFENLNAAPDAGYINEWIQPIQNHTYCLITQNNKYVKLKVNQIYKKTSSNVIDSLTISWVYQGDGTNNFK